MRIAIVDHDVLALGANSVMLYHPGDVRLRAFSHWTNATVSGLVAGPWLRVYIQRASRAGVAAAALEVGVAADHDMGETSGNALEELATIEIAGIAAAVVQQLTRMAEIVVAKRLTRQQAFRCLATVFDKVACERADLLADTAVVTAFVRAKLAVYQAAGITTVGIDPETCPRHSITADASGHNRPPPAKRRPFGKSKLVGVITRHDDKVCFKCEDIAEDGPYTIPQAIGLIPAHPRCRCNFYAYEDRRYAGDTKDAPPQVAFDPEKHPHGYHGWWGETAAAQAVAEFTPAPNPTVFIAARDKSKRSFYLSPVDPQNLVHHTLLLNHDHTAGIAVDPAGDVQNVFNNEGPKGSGTKAMISAIMRGGRTLDCYDGYLPGFYAQFGFVETGRMTFNSEFAHGWKTGDDTPDVVFMAWKGWPPGGAAGAMARGLKQQPRIDHEVTSVRETDWDQAKARSRFLAVQRSGARDHLGAAAEPARSGIDSWRYRYVPAAGEGGGRPLGDEFNPEEERDEHGRWTGSGTALHTEAIKSSDPRSPRHLHVVHDPSTGSKKPYEVWGSHSTRERWRLGSYKTESAARARVASSVEVYRSLEAAKKHDAFDPDEDRDYHGRWTAGGSGGGGGGVLHVGGKPLVAYHGTASEFEQFKSGTPVIITGATDHPGIYFSGDPRAASGFAQRASKREGAGRRRVIAANLVMNNPLDITPLIKAGQKKGLTFGQAKQKAFESLKPEHDGVIFRGDQINSPEYIVFSGEQVKPIKGWKPSEVRTGSVVAPSPPTDVSPARMGRIAEIVHEVADKNDFPKGRITISDEYKTFVLNGKTMSYLGAAWTRGDGQNGEKKGDIKIYPRAAGWGIANDDMFRGAAVHEIMHQKFQGTLDRYREEAERVWKDPGPPPDSEGKYYWQKKGGSDAVVTPSGELREAYKAKYPTYDLIERVYDREWEPEKWALTDGVSDYSHEYWEAFQNGTVTKEIAIHETLAEMARIKQATGKFPEHSGAHLLRVRGKDPATGDWRAKPTAGQITEGTKRWRDLYRAVEKVYKMTVERQKVDGRQAVISYMTEDFAPADIDDATLVKVMFDDGEIVFLTPPAKARDAFDPNEERDYHGRWTAGGGGSAAPAAPPAKAPQGVPVRERLAARRAAANALNAIGYHQMANVLLSIPTVANLREMTGELRALQVGSIPKEQLAAAIHAVETVRGHTEAQKPILARRGAELAAKEESRQAEQRRAEVVAARAIPTGSTEKIPQGELFPELPRLKPKVKDLTDFAKDNIAVDAATRTDPEKAKKFIDTWNEHIAEPPADFKTEFLGGIPASMSINFSDRDNSIEIRGKLKDADDATIGEYIRTIDFENNKASSDYFKLNSRETGHNVGKKLLAANVAYYKKLGLEKVEVHANIDVGGYAWAKYGYVPTESSWSDLQSSLTEKLDELSGGGSSYEPDSWDEMTSDQQDEVFGKWADASRDEFYDSEVENWRDNGGDLAKAKEELADTVLANAGWATNGMAKFAVTTGEGENTKAIGLGKLLIDKGTSLEYVLANTTLSFDDRRGDGEADPDVTIDEEKTKELSDDEREQIANILVEVFNKEAEDRRGDLDPPDLTDNIAEHQRDIWDSMRGRDRFTWARDNDAIPTGESEGTGEIDSDDADTLRSLIDSDDPFAIWAIADSDAGKKLLLGSDWYGEIDFNDPDTMERFNAYVGKTKRETPPATAS